jgi:magnesium-transporting ATPase (P-type)
VPGIFPDIIQKSSQLPRRSSTQTRSFGGSPAISGQEPIWHARTAEEVLQELQASPSGLLADDAAARLERIGHNALPVAPGKPPWQCFLAQFDNLLIYVLIGSAIIAGLLGHAVDAAVILAVVIINAIFGFVQEGRAERALESIRGMIGPKASVLRDGRRVTIDGGEVVPGDILLLEAGDRVTADVRLIKARNLKIDESILTGESLAVEKEIGPVQERVAIGDRRPMAYSGTLVISGQGSGVVVATGPCSELGRISTLLRHVEQLDTPLVRQMNVFARQLTLAIIGLAGVTVAFAVLTRGYPLPEAFMAVVGLAVAANPRRPPGGHDHSACHWRAAHGRAQRYHPPPSRRRDPRLGLNHLLRQDGNS